MSGQMEKGGSKNLANASRCAAACRAIMTTVVLLDVLMIVGGSIASYAGIRLGSIVLLNSWLIWPAGTLACGVTALAMGSSQR